MYSSHMNKHGECYTIICTALVLVLVNYCAFINLNFGSSSNSLFQTFFHFPKMVNKITFDGAGGRTTIRRVLHHHGLKGCHARKMPLFQYQGLKKKSQTGVHRWSLDFWKSVLWPDDTKKENCLAIMISVRYGRIRVRLLIRRGSIKYEAWEW